MNEQIIARFTCSTQEVLKLMLDIEARVGTSTLSDNPDISKDDITVAIGLSGDISGEARFCFPRETALEMVKIMCGMEIGEVDDFVMSAMGEISNIISGKAATGLSEHQIVCDILPPKIAVSETGTSPENGEEIKKINTTIHTTAGNVELAVSIFNK